MKTATANIDRFGKVFKDSNSAVEFVRLNVRIFAVALAIGMCSTAIGQNHYRSAGGLSRQGSVSYCAMKLYIDQMNKMNAEQKRSAAAEANTVLRQAESKIKTYSARGSSLDSELEAAKIDVKNGEKSIEESESALRQARLERTNLEKQLLASQSQQSSYRIASDAVEETENESAKVAERILNRPIKDGNPGKLKIHLTRTEYKALEADTEWVGVYRRFEKAKQQKAAEISRLVASDTSISDLAQHIDRLGERQKKLKSELSAAKAKKTSLANSKQKIDEELAVGENEKNAALILLARINGK